jgi:hypothetical protein
MFLDALKDALPKSIVPREFDCPTSSARMAGSGWTLSAQGPKV